MKPNLYLKVSLTVLINFYFLLLIPLNSQKILHTQGPEGGTIRKHLQNANSTLVGTTHGLFKWSEQNLRWELFQNGIPSFYRVDNFDAKGDSLVLIHSDYYSLKSALNISLDQGENWKTISPPIELTTNAPYYHLIFLQGVLIIGINNNFFESFNLGETWHKMILPDDVDQDEIQYSSKDQKYFYLQTQYKIYRREPKNTQWVLILKSKDYLEEMRTTSQCLLSTAHHKKLMVSQDHGESWSTLPIYPGLAYPFGVVESNDTLYMYHNNEISYSIDSGKQWIHFNYFDADWWFKSIISVGDRLAAIRYSEGIYDLKFDTSRLVDLNKGLFATEANLLYQAQNLIYTNSHHKLLQFDPDQKTWKTIYTLDPDNTITNISIGDQLWVLTGRDPDKLYLSTTQGKSFDQISLSAFGIEKNEIPSKVIHHDSISLILYNKSIYSTDLGIHWKYYEPNYNGNSIQIKDIISLSNYYCALALDVNSQEYSILISEDLINWKSHLDLPLGLNKLGENCTLLNGANQLYLLHQSHLTILFRYDETTHEWKNVIPYLPKLSSNYLSKFKIIDLGNQRLLLNLRNSKWISEDGGNNWTELFVAFDPYKKLYTNDVLLNGPYLYFTTPNHGMLTSHADQAVNLQSGFVYFDQNKNLRFDSTDRPINAQNLEIQNLGKYISTDQTGKYKLNFPSDFSDSLQVVNTFKHGNFYPNKVPLNNDPTPKEFALQIKEENPDVGIQGTLMNFCRPGFRHFIHLQITNHSNKIWNGFVELEMDSIFYFERSNPALHSQNDKLLRWKFDSMQPLEKLDINIVLYTSQLIEQGTNYKLHYRAFHTDLTDADPIDNKGLLSGHVVSSFDPNDIRVVPEQINSKEWDDEIPLEYTVRFQNTGNHPAEFVVLQLPLNSFYENSIEVISSSHLYKTIIQDQLLIFRFDQIHLADSASNEADSHGYIRFRLKPKKDQFVSDQLSNHCDIYFDFNPPVRTNHAITKVLFTSTKEQHLSPLTKQLKVYPNPTQGICRLILPEKITKLSNNTNELDIYNLLGTKINSLTIDTEAKEQALDLTQLRPGLYLARLRDQSLRSEWIVKVE